MKLIRSVVVAIRQRGESTAADIAPLFPQYTADQVANALRGARKNGLLSVRRVQPPAGQAGSLPGLYSATPDAASVVDTDLRAGVMHALEKIGGSGTLEEVCAHVSGHTRSQVMTALRNAANAGLLSKQVGRLRNGRNAPAIFLLPGATCKPVEKRPVAPKASEPIPMEDEDDERPLSHAGLPPRGRIPKVASVWDLGAALAQG